jgi:hypothetical protein
MRTTALTLLIALAAACTNTPDLGCMTDTQCETLFPDEVCKDDPDCY